MIKPTENITENDKPVAELQSFHARKQVKIKHFIKKNVASFVA